MRRRSWIDASIFVIGWTGMRGVLALAAAISVPEVRRMGSRLEQRNLILFLSFCVILVTLVLQGLTLPSLIRVLGLAGTDGNRSGGEGGAKDCFEGGDPVSGTGARGVR